MQAKINHAHSFYPGIDDFGPQVRDFAGFEASASYFQPVNACFI